MKLGKPFVVKIGTNVLTDERGRPNDGAIRAVVDDVAALHGQGRAVILVSSGAVGFGRSALLHSQRHQLDSVAERQLMAATGQVLLMRRYHELFDQSGIAIAQVLSTKHDFQDEAHYRNMQRCFTTLLEHRVVPIVNENDAVSVSELMFTDNDELAGLVATMVGASALIILTSVDGVFTSNPTSPDARLLSEIRVDESLPAISTTGRSTAGRGGMESKLSIAKRVARVGIEVHIVNGRVPGIIGRAAAGDAVGTLVKATKHGSGAQRRLAFATDQAQATITVNAGAITRIRSGAASLLPVGITAVSGKCARGDVVRIVDPAGQLMGIGRAEYSAATLRSKLGLQRQKPFIRYEYLVLYPS